MAIAIAEHVPLAPLTTLGLGGPAARLATITSALELDEIVRDTTARGEPLLVLGGGSNLVVSDAGFAGTVIQLAMANVRVAREGERTLVTAEAGVDWHDFVARMVDAGLAGIECLAGIPGRAGATPMQNVGAYGQEIADTLVDVRAYDRETGRIETFARDACDFAYRTSRFKGSARWIIVDVRFALSASANSQPIRYAELARALGVAEGESAPLARVRDTVVELRRGKGMVVDPHDPESRSAGSFFTNPIVDAETVAELRRRLPEGVVPPTFAAPDGMTKLSAAWLIERAGFTKGYTHAGVGISKKHALALVNRGGTARDLLALAREIQDAVKTKLGVELVPEPVIV